MLRRRGDRVVTNGNSEENLNLITDLQKKNQKENIHSVSSLSAVLLIIAGVLLFDIIVKIGNSTPSPLKIVDEVFLFNINIYCE